MPGSSSHGRVDRIDRLPDGGLAIVDYKTGKPPSQKAVDDGFALQLGLLGLIAEPAGSRASAATRKRSNIGRSPRYRGKFGQLMRPDKDMAAGRIPRPCRAGTSPKRPRKWLTGSEPFTAKLNPAYAPYGDYDQLMRLEEWYGRR